MAQPPQQSSPLYIQRNRFDDRGVQEPPDESTSGGSSLPPTTTMEESLGHLTASDTNTTSSSNPSRSPHHQRGSRRIYNRRILHRPLSTASSSPSWHWSFSTFRHARQQHQQLQLQQLLQRTRMSTLLKRRTFPPPSRALKLERHRFSHPSNKLSRRGYYEGQYDQGSRSRHQRTSLSALLSSWRIGGGGGSGGGSGGGGSSPHIHRLSVRSSMILRESIPTSDLPEVLYNHDDHDEGSSLSSFGSITCTHCANNELCPRHPPQRHRIYNLKKGSNRSGNKSSGRGSAAVVAGMLIRSSEKFIQPPTISSLSSSLSMAVLPQQQRPQPYKQDLHRFSAFWYDGAQGRSGKHQVHVDSLGQVQQNSKHRQGQIQSALFLCGFLIFPLWWIGAWIHCRKYTRCMDPEKRQYPKHFDRPTYFSLSVVSARVVGQVNCCMTCVSLVIIAVMIALGVWLRYWNT